MNYVSQLQPQLKPDKALKDVDRQLQSIIARHRNNPDFWSSKVRDRTDSAHCIFQYPAMMVPIVQRRLLGTILEAQPGAQSLYDPFVGSGTSLVSAMHYGLSIFGNDINPLAVLISRVRTSKSVDNSIEAICARVAQKASEDHSTIVETSLVNREKWFQSEVTRELSQLRRSIRREQNLWVRRFLWVILAETVRLVSNDRTSTYKLHARPLEEIKRRKLSPISLFKELGHDSAKSFVAFRQKLHDQNRLSSGYYSPSSEVKLADTRTNLKAEWISNQPFDLLMTSPPYGDNQTTVTYGQHSYLPLNWIDFDDIDPKADLDAIRTTQEVDRRSLGGRSNDEGTSTESLFAASPTLKQFADVLPPKPSDGYVRLVRFYADFAKSLESMVQLLKPNGYMIWTVGNRSIASKQVPTDSILGELLEAANCKVVTTLTRKIHHKRMPNRNASSATMREEKILLVRKCNG